MTDELPIIGGLVTALVACLSLMTKMWLSARKARTVVVKSMDGPSTVDKINHIFSAMVPAGVTPAGGVLYDFRSNVEFREGLAKLGRSVDSLAESVDRQAAATNRLGELIEQDRKRIAGLFEPMNQKLEELAEFYTNALQTNGR